MIDLQKIFFEYSFCCDCSSLFDLFFDVSYFPIVMLSFYFIIYFDFLKLFFINIYFFIFVNLFVYLFNLYYKAFYLVFRPYFWVICDFSVYNSFDFLFIFILILFCLCVRMLLKKIYLLI